METIGDRPISPAMDESHPSHTMTPTPIFLVTVFELLISLGLRFTGESRWADKGTRRGGDKEN